MLKNDAKSAESPSVLIDERDRGPRRLARADAGPAARLANPGIVEEWK